MSAEKPFTDEVAGERGETLVNRAASIQARLSNVLALSLMCVLGIGSLAWYYANSLTRQSRARQSAQNASSSHAQGDAVLPSLGRIDPPAPPPATAPEVIVPTNLMEDRLTPLASSPLGEAPLSPDPKASGYAPPPPPTPEQIAQARRLSGAVFSNGSAVQGGVPAMAAGGGSEPFAQSGPVLGESAPSGQDALGALLRPTSAPSVRAQMLPARRLLLPKGAFIDCTLETAIDSSLPGMTTCILATDTFGADGKVVLLERGTKLIGETRGQVQQGSARIFVLWTEARTPLGVVVPLDSPGSDELGRSGLGGEVNRHFWERFGAAMLISIVDGAVETAATRNTSGTIIVDPSASHGESSRRC